MARLHSPVGDVLRTEERGCERGHGVLGAGRGRGGAQATVLSALDSRAIRPVALIHAAKSYGHHRPKKPITVRCTVIDTPTDGAPCTAKIGF
jgi:hypothetical protein